MPPDQRTTTRPGPGSGSDGTDRARGVIVTLVVLALGIGILAALPNSAASHGAAAASSSTTTTMVTTTTTSHSGSSTPVTSTTAARGTKVAILAPAGSATEASVQSELSSAGFTLVPEQAVPDSWVSGLAGPFIRYPPGYESAANAVAAKLHVASADVQPDLTGGSVGADVIEVFLPQ